MYPSIIAHQPSPIHTAIQIDPSNWRRTMLICGEVLIWISLAIDNAAHNQLLELVLPYRVLRRVTTNIHI